MMMMLGIFAPASSGEAFPLAATSSSPLSPDT
jgi:hypothetical protein